MDGNPPRPPTASARPSFRLGSVVRMGQPPAAPAPPPPPSSESPQSAQFQQPTPARSGRGFSTLTPSSRGTQPQTAAAHPPRVKSPATGRFSCSVAESSPIPPTQSPETTNFTSLPSPLQLPLPQIGPNPEPETKTLVFRQQIPPLGSVSRHENTNAGENKKNLADCMAQICSNGEEEKGGGMLTRGTIRIAGKNRGAFMELQAAPSWSSTYSKKPISSSTTKQKEKDAEEEDQITPPLAVFINSNVQGVNSSFLLKSSCSQKSPGVHFSHSRKPIYHPPQD